MKAIMDAIMDEFKKEKEYHWESNPATWKHQREKTETLSPYTIKLDAYKDKELADTEPTY